MKLLVGKYYVALRLKNDLCLGVGRPSDELKSEAVLSRKHSKNVEPV